jgi:imidazolonepropionase-like amidohydrolase
MLAARYGLDPEAALVAVTSSPAAILGLDGVGALAPGAAADVVLWTGPPLEPSSRPALVLIAGRIVVDHLPAPPAPAPHGATPPPPSPQPPQPPQRF